jgi:hypothetical protein
MRTRLFPLLLLGLSLLNLRADPRAKATDYPAHAESDHVAIGAEYLVHSFSNGRQSFFVPGYLVVDAAVYPHGLLVIKQAHFKLLLNGQTALAPQDAGMVSYSLQSFGYLDSGGRGGSQFPGDNRGNGPPPPAQAPDPAHPERDLNETADAALRRTTLQEGEFHGPQSGYLYFPFDGKTKKIKSLDLVYKDDAGELTVKLF